MSARHVPDHIRRAAVADYYASNDPAAVVAARHGIPRSTFAKWVQGVRDDTLAYYGGWEVRGLVSYPTRPDRRVA